MVRKDMAQQHGLRCPRKRKNSSTIPFVVQQYRATRPKTTQAMHADPVLGPAIKAKRLRSLKATQDKRTRTKWRHALRHPLFVAYPKRVEAMLPEGNNLRYIDRLETIDAIDKTGTIEQKKRCLRNLILDGSSAILPKFYRKGCAEDGIRYPGDGGPDHQVETDHESDELEEDPEIEKQKEQHAPEKKPRRPRDPEKRRLAARKWAEKDRKINPNRLADRIAKMNEEELAINLAKRRASRSKATNRKDPSW
jgi:hypothetical protein